MGFVLWDTDTANSLASFTTEREALEAVSEIVSQYRSRRARKVSWLLLTEEEGGRSRIVGQGEELAHCALALSEPDATAPAPRRRRAAA